MQQSTTTGEVRPHETPMTDRIVLRLDEACAEARMSTRTMRRLREAGRGPRVVRISDRLIGVRRADLDAWLESRTAR